MKDIKRLENFIDLIAGLCIELDFTTTDMGKIICKDALQADKIISIYEYNLHRMPENCISLFNKIIIKKSGQEIIINELVKDIEKSLFYKFSKLHQSMYNLCRQIVKFLSKIKYNKLD